MFSVLRRIKSLERDNAQKRILAEDMKMKMKMVQENVKSDAAVMVCLHCCRCVALVDSGLRLSQRLMSVCKRIVRYALRSVGRHREQDAKPE